jgi:hypothetical protein
MAKNRTMAIKHAKARQMACKEYKRQALSESMNEVAIGKLTFCTDSMHMGKAKVIGKLKAGKPRKQVSKILLEYYGKELAKYN